MGWSHRPGNLGYYGNGGKLFCLAACSVSMPANIATMKQVTLFHHDLVADVTKQKYISVLLAYVLVLVKC